MSTSPSTATPRDPELSLRPATLGDAHRIWVWRNDPETRQASFDTEPIPLETHDAWFRESLVLEKRRLYVIVFGGTDSGVVRLDIEGGQAEVSIHLAPEARYRGVGPRALSALADLAFESLGIRRLSATIKPDNQPSLTAFAKAGFTLVSGPREVTAVRTGPPR